MCSRQSAVSDKVNGLTIYQNCVINVITNDSSFHFILYFILQRELSHVSSFFLSLVHCTMFNICLFSVLFCFCPLGAIISLFYYSSTFILTIRTGELQYHLVQLLLVVPIFVLCPLFSILLLDIYFPITYSQSHILILHIPFLGSSHTAVLSLYFPVP